MTRLDLTPDLLRAAYAAGVFPMAGARDADDIDWYDPQLRGVMPIAGLHVPRRLIRTMSRHLYIISFNRDFAGVMAGCAGDGGGHTVLRDSTWINDEIIAAFTDLHAQGDAHSVEVWQINDGRAELVGGIYGMALGGAFFGESMFSRARDASKIALVFLVARLWQCGFTLFDAQFYNPHLAQFGLMEITRADYHARLAAALACQVDFAGGNYSPSSNDPGSSCNVGTAADPPDTGDTGAIRSGAGCGAAGSAVATGSFLPSSFLSPSVAASPAAVSFVAGAAAAASSGVVAGMVSAEYVSDAAAVASFLHSITQTS